jgi:predicted RNA binding protein YcfA (HicA-like mRNA interferase family)
MPSIDKVIDFLKSRNALDLSRPSDLPDHSEDENRPWTWPVVDDEHEVAGVDWDGIFPSGSGASVEDSDSFERMDREKEEWNIHPNEDEGRALEEALKRGESNGDPPPNERLVPEGETIWDTCAWYQPIHFYGHDFGIFIKEDCASRIAQRIALFNSRALALIPRHRLWKELFRAAVASLYLHEHYHHKTESFGIKLHAVHGTPRYRDYFNRIYLPAAGTDAQLEEALANASSYRRLVNQPYLRLIDQAVIEATRRYLRHQFPFDPPGYRKAADHLSNAAFKDGEHLICAQINEVNQHPINTPSRSPHDWNMAPSIYAPLYSLKSQIWTVVRRGSRPRLPVRGILHYRQCSTAEMIRLLGSKGFQVVQGGKGSHVKLRKQGVPPVVLPGNRRDLTPGAMRNALAAIGDYRLDDLSWLLRTV